MQRPVAPIKLFLDFIDHDTFSNFYKIIDMLRIKIGLNVKIIFKYRVANRLVYVNAAVLSIEPS
jgi:hypothetical protein